jgi:hypothetical protein
MASSGSSGTATDDASDGALGCSIDPGEDAPAIEIAVEVEEAEVLGPGGVGRTT